MIPRFAAFAVLVGTVQMAAAVNVIREWGAHDPPEFLIETDPQGNAYGVTIWSNAHPEEPWKFEAFDSATGQPGYIDYIRIADGVVVGDIHLSVIGDPYNIPPRLHGAAELKALDLSTNGTPTNRLEQLNITGDFGALGNLLAPSAGTLTIGGALRGRIEVPTITGPITVKELLANIACGTMQDLTVTGPTAALTMPGIVVTGSFTAPYEMDIHQAMGTIEVGQEMSGEVRVSNRLGLLKTHTLSGVVDVTNDLDVLEVADQLSGEVHVGYSMQHLDVLGLAGLVDVGTNVEWAEVSYVSLGGLLDVGGSVGLLNVWNFQDGTIRTGGDLVQAEYWGPISATGTLAVGNDLGGSAEPAFVMYWDLEGTLSVGNDLALGTYTEIVGSVLPGARFLIGRDMQHYVSVHGAMSGQFSVGRSMFMLLAYQGLDGVVDFGRMPTGQIYVEGGNLSGTITVREDMTGLANIRATGGFSGIIQSEDTLHGTVEVTGPMSGRIETANDLATAIVCHGNVEAGASIVAGEQNPNANFTGSVVVNGTAAGSFQAAHDWNGPLTTGVFSGRLHVGNDLLGEVSLSAIGSSAVIDIGRHLANQVFVEDGIGGSISVGGDVQSTIEGGLVVSGTLTADVWVGGNVGPTGGIVFSGLACTPGTIRIDGDMSGTIDIPVLCDLAGDLSQGHIVVNGSFIEGGEIHLRGL